MASTSLTRTPSSNGNQKTWTLSCWIKRTGLGGTPTVIDGYYGNQSRYATIYFDSNNKFNVFSGLYSTGSSTSYLINYTTNRVFRDTNGWYHIVVAVDTTQATAGDRVKIYVNGVQETSFSTETQPAQNTDTYFNVTTSAMRMGVNGLDAVLSHVHWIDGTQYAASTFGSTDSTTGEWKINTSPSVTYGTNGFFIFKDSASVTDQSGNSNNLTVSAGTLTNTEDCPSNVFCTLNPLYNQTGGQGVVLANGNTRSSYNPDSSRSSFGTIAVGTGKYYFEAKLESVGTAPVIGVVDLAWPDINGASGYGYHDNALNFGYNSSGQKTSGGTNTAHGDSYTAGDIIGVAIDKTNNKLYFAKNGVWQNSSDPTSGSTGTGAAYNLASDTLYTSACRMRNGGDWSFNFGNGFFGATAISSEGTNASGIGKFEYDVPTGYTALSTKGLNE